MRVLVANKFWYQRGGLERVMFDEVEGLEAAGHEVAHFSMAHPANEESPWSAYFAPYLELGAGGGLSLGDKAVATARMFSNRDAARRFARLLTDFRPDVVHVHGIHRQVSPSILESARRAGVPVVQTLHDYHHICPADVLLHGGREVCEPRLCGRFWYGPAITGRCVRGSLSASALSAAETSWQRARRTYERRLTRFISPSRFMAARMAEGLWRVPTDVVPNGVTVGAARRGAGEGFVVLGRVSREKGVEVALRAARAAGVPMTVVGEGPLGDELRHAYPEADFTGRLPREQAAALVRGARALVMPSVWYENAPMSVLEAMAAGVPVIASRVGGIPEQFTDGAEGLLVPPGDKEALASAMRRLAEDAPLAERMGENGQRRAREVFGFDTHMRALLCTYGRAIGHAEGQEEAAIGGDSQ